jgi:hypothetical protein
MAGEAAYVPLMSFLHHHHGALRTGGKTPISEQMGEVFYWIAAAEYLWGGVMELIYYNTPTDWLPDMTAATACPEAAERCAFQTCWLNNPDNPDVPRYWHYDDDVSLADPEKLAFLRQAIALRTASPAAPTSRWERWKRRRLSGPIWPPSLSTTIIIFPSGRPLQPPGHLVRPAGHHCRLAASL